MTDAMEQRAKELHKQYLALADAELRERRITAEAVTDFSGSLREQTGGTAWPRRAAVHTVAAR
jgi:hypothetical protein